MSAYFQTDMDGILESLGEALGIEGLEFDDESGTCILQINEQRMVSLTCREEDAEFILHTQVGLLPEEDRFDVVEQLLEANLFWAGTRGATLSMERKSGVVIVARAMSRYASDGELLDGKTVGAAIIDLVDMANYWGNLLTTGITAAGEALQPGMAA